MAKNIIFCADGTWNGPGELDTDDKAARPTNVFKLFLNLDGVDTPDTMLLEKEQERVLTSPGRTVQQWAKYLHGVGDSDNFLIKLLGGSVGAGLLTRIVRGYTFICRNYVSGDKIFIIGFSRGSYTARALGGMIASQGLLPADQCADKSRAYKLGMAVWYRYRRAAQPANAGWLEKLDDALIDIPSVFTALPQSIVMIPAEIEAVAVWETVGALGIPVYARTQVRIDVFQFCNRSLSSKIHNGLHAVALDEEREDYTPTLWDDRSGIRQVLFPGVHADVGGGYNETGIPDCALVWMSMQLRGLGVIFSEDPVYVAAPDPLDLIHQPWLTPPWDMLPRAPRSFPAGFCLSQFLSERLASPARALPPPYDPHNLPAPKIAKATP